jgi:hypothetical protein
MMRKLFNRPEVKLDQKCITDQIEEAKDFFNDPNLPKSFNQLSENPYADKDGLVEFIVGTELAEDPEVMKMLTEQKKHLIAITSVVTDYVNRYSQKYGSEFKTDLDLWALALSKVPLMGPSKIDSQTYSRHIKGVSIATDFLNFILDVVANEGSAMSSFKDFLSKQGEALRFGVSKNKDFYKTITVGVAVEVFRVGNELIYTPKIKQYRVNFDRENTTWSSACASAQFVDINFAYMYAANVFDYEALEDEEIKKAFDKFIQDSRKAQIEDSSTFFNDDF